MPFTPTSQNELDASGNIINPAKEDGNLASIKTDVDNLDVNLSTRATEATLASAKTDLDTLAGAVTAAKVQVNVTNASLTTVSSPNFATRQDTFTATGTGTTVDKSAAPVTKFGIQIKGTGAAATLWTVNLEGSLDNVNFSTILSHVTGTGDGSVMWIGSLEAPALYFRSKVIALTLGSATNIVATILGM